jgi:hypothetical protein
MLLDSRPSPFKPGSILLNVREMNGLSGNMTIESALPGRPVRKMIQVNIMGDEIGQPLDVIRLAAYEQQFIRLDY